MLQRIYKRLRSDKANTLLENVIILPLIIIIIYFMILASFVIHDHSTLDAAAKRGTIYAAKCVSDPNYPMILQQSGHQSGTLDTNVTALSADSFKGVGDNIKPYRYLVMNTADIQDATANEVYNIIQQTKIPWREIETGDIVVKVDNKIIYQNVEVSITARYPLPQIFGNFGLPTEFNYTVSAVTAVNDPDEFIRNVDLIVDVCAAIDQKTGGNIQKVLAKLNDMGTRLTQFLSGENGVGGSGGGGTNPAGGSGGESENIYIADAGDNAGGDGGSEAGEDSERGGIGEGTESGGTGEGGGIGGTEIAGNITPVVPVIVVGDQEEEKKPQESTDATEEGTTEGEEGSLLGDEVTPLPVPSPSSTPEPTATPSVQIAGGTEPTLPTLPQGGTPRGVYAKENSDGNKGQNAAAKILAAAGYDIEMLKEDANNGNGYGIDPKTNPDYLIDGKPFDCYTPGEETSLRTICSTIKTKNREQTDRIVLNLQNVSSDRIDSIKEYILERTGETRDLKRLNELIVILPGDNTIETWYLR